MSKRRGGGGFGGPSMGGGGQSGMMKQLQKMQEDMVKAQEALGEEILEVEVGGTIKIEISGHQRVKSVTINPTALDWALGGQAPPVHPTASDPNLRVELLEHHPTSATYRVAADQGGRAVFNLTYFP